MKKLHKIEWVIIAVVVLLAFIAAYLYVSREMVAVVLLAAARAGWF